MIEEKEITRKLKFLVKVFLKDYETWSSNPEPDDINGGDCALFALVASKILNDGEFYYTDFCGGHAFLKVNNRFYDSTHLDGRYDWKELDSDFRKLFERQLNQVDEMKLISHWHIGKRQLNAMMKNYSKISSPRRILHKKSLLPKIAL